MSALLPSSLRRTASLKLLQLASSSTNTIRRSLTPTSASASAYFSTSSVRVGLKEGDTNRDNIPEEYERLKHESLRDVRAGKGSWNQALASESEADVKADRGEVGVSGEDMQRLKEGAVKGRK